MNSFPSLFTYLGARPTDVEMPHAGKKFHLFLVIEVCFVSYYTVVKVAILPVRAPTSAPLQAEKKKVNRKTYMKIKLLKEDLENER